MPHSVVMIKTSRESIAGIHRHVEFEFMDRSRRRIAAFESFAIRTIVDLTYARNSIEELTQKVQAHWGRGARAQRFATFKDVRERRIVPDHILDDGPLQLNDLR